MVGTSARTVHAPFVRNAGGLQSVPGTKFPLNKCWIIKTARHVKSESATRQSYFLSIVYHISLEKSIVSAEKVEEIL